MQQQVLSSKLSGRILKAAREQQQQVEDEEAGEELSRLSGLCLLFSLHEVKWKKEDDSHEGACAICMPLSIVLQMGASSLGAALKQRAGGGDSEEDSDAEDEYETELRTRAARTASSRAAGQEEYVSADGFGEEDEGDDEIGAEDEQALAAFMAPDAGNNQ
jgi:hypothetical protein